MLKMTCLLAALMLGATMTPAWGMFHVDRDQAAACQGRQVTEIGAGVAVPMQGFGHAVALSDAIKVLLPPGWIPSVDPAVKSVQLTWKEGDSWTQAATSGQDQTVCYVIDWYTRTFYVSRNVAAMEKAVAESDPNNAWIVNSHIAQGDGSAAPTAGTSAKAESATDSKLWYLNPGSMRDQMDIWAENAGYALVWNAPDFLVGNGVNPIHGDFQSAVSQGLSLASTETGLDYVSRYDQRSGTLNISLTRSPTAAPEPEWSLHPGALKEQLTGWASIAKYQVVWNADSDFQISTNATISGSFPDAVQQLIDGLRSSGSKITAQIFEGNHTVVIGESH